MDIKLPVFIKDIRKNSYSYLLLFPSMLYTIIFGYLTYPYILIAFQKFNYKKGILGSDWSGFENFSFYFKMNDIWVVTWNTVKLNLLFLFFGTIFAVFFSIIMNEIKAKLYLKFTQSLFIFPNFISWVIASYFIFAFFTMDGGIINYFLAKIGVLPINWYGTPAYWPTILVILKIWKGTGISAIVYLAAITGFDSSIYEAAIIDGANRWQKIKFITIPMLTPTISILSLLSIGRIFYGDFGMIYAIIRDNGVLFPTTEILDTYVYRSFRRIGDPSKVMAISLYQSVLGFILVYVSNRIVRKYNSDAALY